MARIGGFDLMILTETRITDQDYYCNRVIYNVVCSPMRMIVVDGAQGGV